MNKNKIMILNKKTPINFDGKQWTYETSEIEVIVMSLSGKYAMVRRKGCMPFVVEVKKRSYNSNDER